MKKLVLLDSNSLINRAFYAMPPLNLSDGTPTNAVYGFTNMLIKIINEIKPTNIVAVFDLPAPTFRKKMYPQYKATRDAMSEELAVQFPILKELLTKMGIQIQSCEGYEADDLIGTLANKCDFETIIITGDKDSLQLISQNTKVWLTKKGISEIIEYDLDRLAQDGLSPYQIIELKALMGDKSDNIPGVPGVGEKTAKTLLDEYNNLDNIYANINQIKGKLQEKLIENKELAYLSKELATINVNSPIDFDTEKSILNNVYNNELKSYLEYLKFNSVIPKLQFVEESGAVAENKKVVTQQTIINNVGELKTLISNLENCDKIAFDYNNDFYLASNGNTEYRVQVKYNLLDEGIDFDIAFNSLKSILEDIKIVKYVYDVKTLWHKLNGKFIKNAIDLALMNYVCDANSAFIDKEKIFELRDMEHQYPIANAFKLFDVLSQEINDNKQEYLYYQVELPLTEVLYDMEKIGFRVDLNLMDKCSVYFNNELENIRAKIYQLAGKEFNVNSSQQLAKVLFEDLNLPTGKKTKQGYSTNIEVLEYLEDKHDIVGLIIRYREIAKLLSTYIDGMRPLLVDGRLHTVFKQMKTATGRLSSTEPNLQNIPIRKPIGKELRKMFIASDGCQLLCADYSQIELRLLAHFSEDEVLLDAYKNAKDIHAITASKAFGVELEKVTSKMRSNAKAVNFGIIYGISDFGLAKDIGMGVAEAKRFIEKYFETYPSVKKYMDNNVAFAKEHGYITTLLNRIRKIPELKSGKFSIKSFGERIAMNLPLQGSASDIIKVAMVNIYKELCAKNLKAKLVLQVHDELIIDCPREEIEEVGNILNKNMVEAVKLKVDLVADVDKGENWYDAK